MPRIWMIIVLSLFAWTPAAAANEQQSDPVQVNTCSASGCDSLVRKHSNRSPDQVTIALADSLVPDRAKIDAVLQNNPHVRITEVKAEAEYLLARYPDFPDALILVDIEFHFPDDQSPGRFERAEEYIAQLYYRFALNFPTPWISQTPYMVGQIDDGTFAIRLQAEVQKILWLRRLLVKAQSNPEPEIRTRVARLEYTCLGEDDSLCFDPYYSLTVENRGSREKYLAIVRFDNENGSRILRPLSPGNQRVLRPGAIETRSGTKMPGDDDFGDLAPDPSRTYVYVTIASDQPIDPDRLTLKDSGLAQVPENWIVSARAQEVTPINYGGGGFIVPELMAPWQVQLYSTSIATPRSLQANTTLSRTNWRIYEKTHRCGGTLIARNIVLTAAHCVANAPFAGSPAKRLSVLKYRRIKLGTQNLSRGGTTAAIDSIVVHKNYRPGGHPNDIALIRIKPDESTLSWVWNKTKPISLPKRRVASNSKVRWYGWGVTEEVAGSNTRLTSGGQAQRNPADLRFGEMDILTRRLCQKRPGYGRKVTNFMLCAVTPRDLPRQHRGKRIFTCLGDSGGPIMGYEEGKNVQVGIISWAVGCGANDNPSVSAYIYPYLKWIAVAKTKFVSGRVVPL